MSHNLTGEYKEAYKHVQKLISQERLHPRVFKDARNDLIQYLETCQNEQNKIEDYEVIKNIILKDTLYRSKRTHFLMWVAIPLMFVFVISIPNLVMNYAVDSAALSIQDIVLAYYLSFALIEGIPNKYVLLFIFAGIPVALIGVMLGTYFQIYFDQINLLAVMILCLFIYLISNYFINKEYKDWKRNM